MVNWTQSCPWVHLCDPTQPNPSADWANPTQPTTSGKIWTQPDATQYRQHCLVVNWELHVNFAISHWSVISWPQWQRGQLPPGAAGEGVLWPCVCPLQVGLLWKRMNEPSWFFAWRLPSTYPRYAMLYENSRISKNKGKRVILSRTLSQTPDFKNVASSYWSSKLVINLAWQRWTLKAW